MAHARTPAAAPPGWAAAAMTRPWRYLVAVVVFVNGFAHLAGTTEALGAAEDGTSLDYLGGAWVVSDPTTLRVAAAGVGAAGRAVRALRGLDLDRRLHGGG